MDMKEKLVEGIAKLLKLKGECYIHVVEDLELSEMSIKQIKYLKKINHAEGVTTSQLADLLDLSKPSITEMVKKFIKMGYVYKESCHIDGRVHYLKLTDKGLNIVNLDKLTTAHLAENIENRLNDEDLTTLIDILEKIE